MIVARFQPKMYYQGHIFPQRHLAVIVPIGFRHVICIYIHTEGAREREREIKICVCVYPAVRRVAAAQNFTTVAAVHV